MIVLRLNEKAQLTLKSCRNYLAEDNVKLKLMRTQITVNYVTSFFWKQILFLTIINSNYFKNSSR